MHFIPARYPRTVAFICRFSLNSRVTDHYILVPSIIAVIWASCHTWAQVPEQKSILNHDCDSYCRNPKCRYSNTLDPVRERQVHEKGLHGQVRNLPGSLRSSGRGGADVVWELQYNYNIPCKSDIVDMTVSIHEIGAAGSPVVFVEGAGFEVRRGDVSKGTGEVDPGVLTGHSSPLGLSGNYRVLSPVPQARTTEACWACCGTAV